MADYILDWEYGELAEVEGEDGNKLFDSDIDDALAEILGRRADENSGKRPDIALFSKEGSAIIVEFKALGVSMDNHTGYLSEYAHLLAAKSGGRLKKFYGYLIGDTVNQLRLGGWIRSPTGQGFFQTSPLIDTASGQTIGELYEEVIFYNDIKAGHVVPLGANISGREVNDNV